MAMITKGVGMKLIHKEFNLKTSLLNFDWRKKLILAYNFEKCTN